MGMAGSQDKQNKTKKMNGIFSLSKPEDLWGNHLIDWDVTKWTAQKSYIRRYLFFFPAKDAEEIPQYLMLFNLKGQKWGRAPSEETGKSDIRVESAGHPGILKEFGNGSLRCKERCSLNQNSFQRAASAVRNTF